MSKKVELYFVKSDLTEDKIIMFAEVEYIEDTHKLTITTDENSEPLENKEAYEEMYRYISELRLKEVISEQQCNFLRAKLYETKTAVIEKL